MNNLCRSDWCKNKAMFKGLCRSCYAKSTYREMVGAGYTPIGVERVCPGCNNVFIVKSGQHKYCTLDCYKQFSPKFPRRRKKYPISRNCKTCGIAYPATNETHTYCSVECRKENERKLKADKVLGVSNKYPRGHYVYGWYQKDDPLPFYIGMGTSGRAWARHIHGNDSSASLCELRRNSETRIVIYRDKLTSEGALLVESVLISVFRDLGAELVNQVAGLKRQEKQGLEIV